MENMDATNIGNLGDLIKYHRQKKDFSIIELSKKTKIRVQQLISLEENKLSELPNRVYLVGFLKTLCDELEINLDLALKFLNENTIRESSIEFLQLGKEIKPIHFKFIKKSSDNKILIAAILLCSLTIVASIGLSKNKDKISKYVKERQHSNVPIVGEKQLEQVDVVTFKAAAVSRNINLSKETIVPGQLIASSEMMMSKELAPVPKAQTESKKIAPLMQQLTITAKNGTAFLAYRVDQNRLVKFYLQKGKTLELKGEQIRVDAGNPDALEFTKNGEPLAIEKSAHIHLVLPEEDSTAKL